MACFFKKVSYMKIMLFYFKSSFNKMFLFQKANNNKNNIKHTEQHRLKIKSSSSLKFFRGTYLVYAYTKIYRTKYL